MTLTLMLAKKIKKFPPRPFTLKIILTLKNTEKL